jgi:hypothetical protein
MPVRQNRLVPDSLEHPRDSTAIEYAAMIKTARLLLCHFIVLLSLTVICAHAQKSANNELGLILGATRTPSLTIAGNGGSIEVGTGISFQVTYARQLMVSDTLAWYLEFPAVAIPLQDVSNPDGATPLNYDSFFVAIKVPAPRERSSVAFGRRRICSFRRKCRTSRRYPQRDARYQHRRAPIRWGTRCSNTDQSVRSHCFKGRGARFLHRQTSLQREYHGHTSAQSCVFGRFGAELLSEARVRTAQRKLSRYFSRLR